MGEDLEVEMVFSWTLFTGILCFFGSIVVPNFGEPFVIRQASTDRGFKRMLTSVSDNDDSASIRNRESESVEKTEVPSALRHLEAFDADEEFDTISLRWEPPYPPNGQIESYHVSFNKEGKIWKNWTIEASNGIPMCELFKNYICLENLPFPPHDGTKAKVQVVVYAKNKKVEHPGTEISLAIEPGDAYDEAPGQPLNLEATHQGQGMVKLAWKPPSISCTRIKRFTIIVDLLQTYLLEKPTTNHEMTMNHAVLQTRKEYSTMLALLASTEYQISVVGVNWRNESSLMIKTQLLVPGSVGFTEGVESEERFTGSLMNIRIPRVVNATRNTTGKVIVKGSSTCSTSDQPVKSFAPANSTRSVMEWDAADYQAGDKAPESVQIFAEWNQGLESNCSLHPGESYSIVFLVVDWSTNSSAEFTSSPIHLDTHHASLAWLAILPILTICVMGLCVWSRTAKVPESGKDHEFDLDSMRREISLHEDENPR